MLCTLMHITKIFPFCLKYTGVRLNNTLCMLTCTLTERIYICMLSSLVYIRKFSVYITKFLSSQIMYTDVHQNNFDSFHVHWYIT